MVKIIALWLWVGQKYGMNGKRLYMGQWLWVALWTGLSAFSVCGQVENELPLKSVVEAGACIDTVGNETVRVYLQRRLEGILGQPAWPERQAALEAFLTELRAAALGVGTNTETRLPGGAASPDKVVVNRQKASPRNTDSVTAEKDVELINLLTQYACILQDLEGRGYVAVRRELSDNVNLAGLGPEDMMLLRQLVMVCNEVERTVQSAGYIEEDVAKETKALYLQNLGAYGASSIMSGNPLPLLQAAAAIVKGRYELSKERDRKLGIEIQNHRGRLANYLFELGVRRSTLKERAGVGEALFLGKEAYAQLQSALTEDDLRKRAELLTQCVAGCPASREALYCLAAVSHAVGEVTEAERYLRELTERKSLLLYRDGLRATAYDQLADYAMRRGEYSNTLALATSALECDPQTAGAYNHLALASLKLGGKVMAYKTVARALNLDPMNGAYLWTAAQVAAELGEQDQALTFLRAAMNNGFHDAAAILGCVALRAGLGTARGRQVLQPPLTTHCTEQLINHRFAVSNMAGYAVSGLVVRLTVKYEAGDKPVREESFMRRMAVLPAGGVVGFSMAGAPKGGFRCRMQLEYQCRDYPDLLFRAVSCYNMEGEEEHLEWPDYLHRRAVDALKTGDRKQQEEGFKFAVEAAERTAHEDVEILGTCMRLALAIGDEAAAERFSTAMRKAMTNRPLTNSVQVEAAVKRLGSALEKATS